VKKTPLSYSQFTAPGIKIALLTILISVSTEADLLGAADGVVRDRERPGQLAGLGGAENHVDRARRVDRHTGTAVVGLRKISAGRDATDGQRRCSYIR
jgi:hypothetical protein